jgi:glutamate-1-semialdehyde 2,1-aminomutase
MWTVFFGVTEVHDATTARACDTTVYARWFRGMLERGVYLPPSQFEAAFVSLAHGGTEIDQTITAARAVAADLG